MLKNESAENSNSSIDEIQIDRPEPIISNIDVVPYKHRMQAQAAINELIQGNYVLIVDFYSSGLEILNELKKYIKHTHSDQTFQGQREYRSIFHELSHRLLLKISNHKIVVRKAPDVGWFKILYPDNPEFLLSFSQVQGLNSSWQWYTKGIFIPVLNRKIYPWYGSYFPTRFEHLELFDHWLKGYHGEKKSAYDIGIGSGILTFQMLKYGFEKIYATDSNPNAIVGLIEDLNENNLNSKVELTHGDLFTQNEIKSELIVFNPPWLPVSDYSDRTDRAIYYDADLFPRFFEEAKKHLSSDGKIVLLFSNLAQVTNLRETNPIEEELFNGYRFKKDFFIQKKVHAASHQTKRNQNWRSSEMVELWVLKHADHN